MSTRQMRGSDRLPALRRALLARDGIACQICRQAGRRIPMRQVVDDGDPFAWTIDHIVPRNEGGLHFRENLQLVHRICNERKSGHFRAGWDDVL